jgi:hypothetical protein
MTVQYSLCRRRSFPAGSTCDMREAVRVWWLGGFRVSVGSRTIAQDAWRLRKVAALVKLLVSRSSVERRKGRGVISRPFLSAFRGPKPSRSHTLRNVRWDYRLVRRGHVV